MAPSQEEQQTQPLAIQDEEPITEEQESRVSDRLKKGKKPEETGKKVKRTLIEKKLDLKKAKKHKSSDEDDGEPHK